MSIISFTYRCCLDLVHKESLFQIVAFLGVSASKSANMPSMIWEIDFYVKGNLADAFERLCEGIGTAQRGHQVRFRHSCGKSIISNV